jgi:hypothetical protein
MEEDRLVEGGVDGSVIDKTTCLDGEVPGERGGKLKAQGSRLKAQGSRLKAQGTYHCCGF